MEAAESSLVHSTATNQRSVVDPAKRAKLGVLRKEKENAQMYSTYVLKNPIELRKIFILIFQYQ